MAATDAAPLPRWPAEELGTGIWPVHRDGCDPRVARPHPSPRSDQRLREGWSMATGDEPLFETAERAMQHGTIACDAANSTCNGGCGWQPALGLLAGCLRTRSSLEPSFCNAVTSAGGEAEEMRLAMILLAERAESTCRRTTFAARSRSALAEEVALGSRSWGSWTDGGLARCSVVSSLATPQSALFEDLLSVCSVAGEDLLSV